MITLSVMCINAVVYYYYFLKTSQKASLLALKNARIQKYLCHTRVSAQNAGSLAVVRPCSAALRLVAFIFSLPNFRTSRIARRKVTSFFRFSPCNITSSSRLLLDLA